ncbi:hypothetical protein [Sulfurospirillum arsenophilum]
MHLRLLEAAYLLFRGEIFS